MFAPGAHADLCSHTRRPTTLHRRWRAPRDRPAFCTSAGLLRCARN